MPRLTPPNAIHPVSLRIPAPSVPEAIKPGFDADTAAWGVPKKRFGW
jgi:hypothetical protein